MAFLDNGSQIGQIGSANVVLQSCCMSITVTLIPGSHTVTAIYSGDASHVGSTSLPLTLTAPSVTITSSSDPSDSGQPITFTATVAPSNATGVVEFSDGSWSPTCGSPTPCPQMQLCLNGTTGLGALGNPYGQVNCIVNFPKSGTYSMEAIYAGDDNYVGGVSAPVTQTVTTQVYTSITLSSFPNPSVVNNSVTFTATVSPYSQSGTVTFLDGGTNIGSSPVTLSSTAQFATKTLSLGSHQITAAWDGASAVLTQNVQ